MSKVTIKRSNVAGKVPTISDIDFGELAINTYDGRLFFKKKNGIETVVEVSMTTHSHDHNLLDNLDGGGTDGYYHLDLGEYNFLQQAYDDGYWSQSKGGTNQTSYTSGDILYANTDNILSKLPIGDDGYVLTVSGNTIGWEGLGDIGDDSRWVDIDRNGFVDNTKTAISFNDTTYTFTLTDVGTGWKYMRAGIEYTISGSKQIRLVPEPGLPVDGQVYFITINGNDGALTVSTSVWDLNIPYLPVAVVRWNSTLNPNYFLEDERHTCKIDRKVHKYLHETAGTKYVSGGNVSGYTINTNTNAANTVGISQAIIADEDLYSTLAPLIDGNGTDPNNYLITYRSAGSWVWKYSDMPFSYTPGGYIDWDNNGVLTQGTGGSGSSVRYYNTYIIFTNGVSHSRFLIVPGQNQYTTVDAAYEEKFNNFYLIGFPKYEWLAKYQLTWRTGAASLTNKGKCQLTRDPAVISQSTVTVAVPTSEFHNTLNGLQGGTTNEYYHLKSLEHSWLVDSYTDGYWSAINGGTDQTTYDPGDILYASDVNKLSKLPIVASDGYVLSSDGGFPSWKQAYSIVDPIVNPFFFTANCLLTDVVGACVYISGDSISGIPQVSTVDVSDVNKMPAIGIIQSKSSPTDCIVAYFGSYVFAGAAPNSRYFVGDDGGLSVNQPSVRPCIVQIMGQALDSNRVFIDPQKTIFKLN